MIGIFIKTFLGFILFVLILIGGVAGMIFGSLELTKLFAPYPSEVVSNIVFFSFLILIMGVLIACARACEDM